jgi:hypothetical protein
VQEIEFIGDGILLLEENKVNKFKVEMVVIDNGDEEDNNYDVIALKDDIGTFLAKSNLQIEELSVTKL